jgi:hypothetical protein
MLAGREETIKRGGWQLELWMLEEGRRERGDRRGEGCEASGMRERERGGNRERRDEGMGEIGL